VRGPSAHRRCELALWRTEVTSAARELLDLVDGAGYLPGQIRVAEIDLRPAR